MAPLIADLHFIIGIVGSRVKDVDVSYLIRSPGGSLLEISVD